MAQYILFDTETTGTAPEDRIIQVGGMIIKSKTEGSATLENRNGAGCVLLQALPRHVSALPAASLVEPSAESAFNYSINFMCKRTATEDHLTMWSERLVLSATLTVSLAASRMSDLILFSSSDASPSSDPSAPARRFARFLRASTSEAGSSA